MPGRPRVPELAGRFFVLFPAVSHKTLHFVNFARLCFRHCVVVFSPSRILGSTVQLKFEFCSIRFWEVLAFFVVNVFGKQNLLCLTLTFGNPRPMYEKDRRTVGRTD